MFSTDFRGQKVKVFFQHTNNKQVKNKFRNLTVCTMILTDGSKSIVGQSVVTYNPKDYKLGLKYNRKVGKGLAFKRLLDSLACSKIERRELSKTFKASYSKEVAPVVKNEIMVIEGEIVDG